MKRFVLKDKLFSLGGDLTIQDEHGRQVYYVDGKVISLGRRLEIRDEAGNHVATIQQRLVALRPTYEIDLPGDLHANISERFSLMGDKLKIDLPGDNDLVVHGDLFHHEYDVDLHGKRVARVTKQWVSLVDAYGVEVEDEHTALLILTCAVVIDQLLDKERSEHD
jgi:uncharacterized protein YxjI